MEILYLVSVLILLISFILVKKTDKKINIISFLCISIVTLFCYNAFICYVLTFFVIPIKLWLITIINIVIAIMFNIPIIVKKQIQKYVLKKIDILYLSIIAIVVLLVSYINFGFPFNVKYETSDPSVHYLTARMFAENDALLANVENDEVYGTFSTRKTVSYVNSGLLMKCICPDFEAFDCYNVFVCFGMFTLFLTGASLYSAMSNFSKSKENHFIAFIIALICMLGYPLNSFLFGFEYLSMGLLIICSIIDLINYYTRDEIRISYMIGILSLLNFGVFCAYYMFVPFIYPAEWIYFCIENYCKTKKILTKQLIFILLITLLIPFILGAIYHLLPEVYSVLIKKDVNTDAVMQYSDHLVNSAFSAPGYIYINIYSNMILLIPLTIYLVIKDIKNNKLIALLIGCAIVFIELLFVGYGMGKVSIYYLSKNYFALWILLLYANFKALVLISEKNKIIPRIFVGTYIILMVICTIFSNVKVEDVLKNKDEKILSVMEIFGANKTILFEKQEQFNQEEIQILKYAKDNLDYKSKIEVVADRKPYYWAYPILRYVNPEEGFKKIGKGQNRLNLKIYLLEGKINKVDYMIYFKKSDTYKKLEDKLFENSQIIYENESGGILKYNK